MARDDVTVTMAPERGGEWKARPPSLPPRWRIVQELGRGGQAEVWLAVDQHLAQQVAVKVFSAEMSPLQRERMRREVRLGRTLQHPGLVRVFELVEVGERTAVVMEFVPGGSLAAAVADGPLDPERVVAVADEVLSVLVYLHRQGVVHRDLKPSNLLVDREGHVRVADLGLARHWEGGDTLTESCTTLGTPRYMSPEQVRGEKPLPQSDLYSLGATLFHLLAGCPPFDHDSAFEVARLHLSAPVPDPRRWRPDCPHWLAHFVMRLLEKRPGDRFTSARQALEVLRSRSAASLPARRRRAAVAVLAAAVLLAAGWGALVQGGRVPASVRVSGGNKVVVSDDEDRLLWERSFSVGVKDAALVPGKGRPPRVYVATTSPRSASAGGGLILELDARGEERASFSVADHLAAYFPDLGRSASAERLLGADVDGDGEAELTWVAKHFFYPSAVGVWWRQPRALADHVFINSGHLTSVAWADLDGDGRREMVMAGFNNRLGYQGMVAVVEPGGGEMWVGRGGMVSPDQVVRYWGQVVAEGREPRAYVPLGVWTGEAVVEAAGSDGILVRVGGQGLRLDGDGNPQGSPLFGKGGERRRAFWREVTRRAVDQAAEGHPRDVLAALRSDFPEILAEGGSAVSAALILAEQWAHAGRHGESAWTLAEAAQNYPQVRDLWVRLGQQRVLAGDLKGGRAALREALRAKEHGRPPADALVALGLTHILFGDPPADRWAEGPLLELADGDGTIGAHLRCVAAVCRGDWAWAAAFTPDRNSLVSDARVAHLWALALQENTRGDSLAQLRELASSSDVSPAAGVVLEILEPSGRGWEAVRQRLLRLAEELDEQARWSLSPRLWQAVAERALALVEGLAGNEKPAAQHLARAQELAPACSFAGGFPLPEL